MEFSRAQQIVSSPDKIDVFYKGSVIWIEGLNENNQTAYITNIENHQKSHVPVSLLFELY